MAGIRFNLSIKGHNAPFNSISITGPKGQVITARCESGRAKERKAFCIGLLLACYYHKFPEKRQDARLGHSEAAKLSWVKTLVGSNKREPKPWIWFKIKTTEEWIIKQPFPFKIHRARKSSSGKEKPYEVISFVETDFWKLGQVSFYTESKENHIDWQCVGEEEFLALARDIEATEVEAGNDESWAPIVPLATDPAKGTPPSSATQAGPAPEFLTTSRAARPDAADARSHERGKEYDEVRRGYLEWLERELQYVPGGVAIDQSSIPLQLDQVYVSLKGYLGASAEIHQAVHNRRDGDRYATPLRYQERERSGHYRQATAASFDLGRAFTEHKTMVVLGDPGSGKTTLVRWLALTFARALRNGETEVQVRAKNLDLEAIRPERGSSLGTARLPVFIRVADLAKAYNDHDDQRSLEEFLGIGSLPNHPVYPEGSASYREKIDKKQITELIDWHLRQKSAVIFLDGLDEVPDDSDRGLIVELIHEFLETVYFDEHPGEPVGGNQLVVTSRVIGYEQHPLRDRVAKFTIEPLSEKSIEIFSRTWHQAYFTSRIRNVRVKAAENADVTVEAFLLHIFDPARTALRELATNPLLLTLLCTVFQENRQKLPESRAQLYEVIVTRGLNALFLSKNRTSRKREPMVRATLIAIATRAHVETTDGLLEANEIRQIVNREMPNIPGGFSMIVEGVGLLSERGDKRYAFRHQTIQEYLVGLDLKKNAERRPQVLLERAAEPRWREVILLALGTLGNESTVEGFAETCRQLLEYEHDAGLPLGAILIVQATRDFIPLQPSILTAAIITLLKAYGGTALNNPSFTTFVEASLSRLNAAAVAVPKWRRAIEDALVFFIENGKNDERFHRVRTIAQLVRNTHCRFDFLVESFLGACLLEDSSTEWTVNQVLEQMITLAASPAVRFRRVEAADVFRLKPETRAALQNPELIEGLQRVRPQPFQPVDLMDAGFPVEFFPMRQALEYDATLVNRILGSPQWLQIILSLYGGAGTRNVPALRQEVRDGITAITASFASVVSQQSVAIALDNNIQPNLEVGTKQSSANFNVKLIFRDSPLTSVLLHALRADQAPQDLVATLERLWEDPAGPATAVLTDHFKKTAAGRHLSAQTIQTVLLGDILVALLVLVDFDRHPLNRATASSLQDQALIRFRQEVQRLAEQQRDTLMRNSKALEEFWNGMATNATALTEEEIIELGAVVREVLALTERRRIAGFNPISIAFKLQPETRAAVLAASWRHVFLEVDDVAYNLAVSLDTVGALLSASIPALIESFYFSIPFAREAGWDTYRMLFFRSTDASPLHRYLGALLFLLVVPQDGLALVGWSIIRIIPHLRKQFPDLEPLAVVVASLVDQAHRVGVAVSALSPELGDENPLVVITKVNCILDKIADDLVRFYTARALKYLQSTAVKTDELIQFAMRILSPQDRYSAVEGVLHEYLIEAVSTGNRDQMRDVLKGVFGGGSLRNLRLLISSATSEADRSGLPDEPGSSEESELAQANETEKCQKRLADLAKKIKFMERLAAASPTKSAEASTVAHVLIGLRLDMVECTQNSVDRTGDWTTLLDLPADSPRWNDVIRDGLAHGLTMAAYQASKIDAVDRELPSVRQALARILPLVTKYEPAAMAMIRMWASRRDESVLEKWASLIMGEHGQWDPSILVCIFNLLTGDDTGMRNRAALALIFQRGRGQLMTSSRVGFPTLLEIGRISEQRAYQLPKFTLMSVWAFESIRSNEPAFIAMCDAQLKEGGAQILRNLNYASAPVIEAAIAMLATHANPEVVESLLIGLRLAYLRNLSSTPPDHPLFTAARAALEKHLCSDSPSIRMKAAITMGFYASSVELGRCVGAITQSDKVSPEQMQLLAIHSRQAAASVAALLDSHQGLFARIKSLASSRLPIAPIAGEILIRCGYRLDLVRTIIGHDPTFLRACFASVDELLWGASAILKLNEIAQSLAGLVTLKLDGSDYNGSDLFTQAIILLNQTLAHPAGYENRIEHRADDPGNILMVCASMAELMPEIYRRIVLEQGAPVPYSEQTHVFVARLKRAVEQVNSFPSRQAGVVLLSLIRTFSAPVAAALSSAVTDVYPVQITVLSNVDRFRQLDARAFSELKYLLLSPNSNVAYLGTRILLAIVDNEQLPSEQRESFLHSGREAIGEALNLHDSLRIVTVLDELENDSSSFRIRAVGTIGEIFRDALSRLACAYLIESPQDTHSRSRQATLRIRHKVGNEFRSFDLRVGDQPGTDPVAFQQRWLKAAFKVELPRELTEALSDVRQVAGTELSCGELLTKAVRFPDLS